MERVIWSKEWHTNEERVILAGWSSLWCGKLNENIILSGTRSAQFPPPKKQTMIIVIVMCEKVQIAGIYFTFPPGKKHRLNFLRRDVRPIQQQQKNQCVCQVIGELLYGWWWGISVCKRLLVALLKPQKTKDKQTNRKHTFDRKFQLWISAALWVQLLFTTC